MNNQTDDFVQAEELQRYIEKEVLNLIKNLAEHEGTTKDTVQYIAKITLELIHPGMKLDELYQSAVKLDDFCPELSPVVVLVMREYEKKYHKKALDQVNQLIKSKKFDQASSIVKKILSYKSVN
jgi:hypothetical protein